MYPTFDGTMQEFETFVNQNKLLLYSIVYGISGSMDADDIVQETFIYAYYHYDKLQDKKKLLPWLCAIARNKAYSSSKRSCKTVSLDVLGRAVSHVTPEAFFLKKEEQNELMRSIANLSEKNRETLLLYYFAEKSIREISDILSIPEGTVKFRLYESRKKLKKELFYMIADEKKRVEQEDIFTRIKEETEKAYQAIEANNTKLASDLCDASIPEIQDFSVLTKEELDTLARLYRAKFRSIQYAEGDIVKERYLKKIVEIAEASKDAEWMSDAYSIYGGELSNMGRKEESDKYRERSLEKARECGKPHVIANSLYWNGISAYRGKTEDRGLSYFTQVIRMKEELFQDEEHECLNATTFALAYSAYVVLNSIGESGKILNDFQATAPVIARTADGYSLAEQQGYSEFDVMNGMCADIFYYISTLVPCLSVKIKEGYVFEQNTFSYSHNPVRSRYEVISINERYEAPAGTFAHCLHIRYTNYVAADDCELNRRCNGVTDIWYAPNVGVAGIQIAQVENVRVCLKLKEYAVESARDVKAPELYLPLCTGNIWTYAAFDLDDVPLSNDFDSENRFEVVYERKSDNAAVISHSAWSRPVLSGNSMR